MIPAALAILLVVCAPGYPGSTAEAQPAMDGLAQAVAKTAGLPPGSVGAVYFETEEGGLDRLARPDAVLALVTLPFYFQDGARLKLKPELQVVQEKGSSAAWSLVAKRGRVTSAASLEGWEVTGIPGYSPGFVRGPVLGAWGAVPATAKITATSRPLTALRRAAAGENVAVLLDETQVAGLSSLPQAKDLEVVAKSKPLPSSLLCFAGERLGSAEARKILDALLRLHESEEGRSVLTSLQMIRFERADRNKIEGALR